MSKTSVIGLGVLAVTFGLLLCIWEALFPLIAPHIPLSLQSYVDRDFRMLYQPTKKGALPSSDYVAILGDSYAQGAGDWPQSIPSHTNTPYGLQSIIHDKLGKDTVTFGVSGASNTQGLVVYPISALESLQARFKVGKPAKIYYLFYEGNDVTDNIRETEPSSAMPKIAHPTVRAYSVGIRFLWSAASMVFGRIIHYRPSWWFKYIHAIPPTETVLNDVPIGTSTVSIPARLQGPAMELDSADTARSLGILDQDLGLAEQYFGTSTLTFIYIPSVARAYNLRDSGLYLLDAYKPELRGEYKGLDIKNRGQYIEHSVRDIVTKRDLPFVDATPILQALAKDTLIHGPRDYAHLNKIGVEEMAKAVLATSSQMLR